MGLEKNIQDYFSQSSINYKNNTDSTSELDFVFSENGKVYTLEAKEKTKAYSLSSWGLDRTSEPFAFIIDDFTIRKMLYNSLKYKTISSLILMLPNGDLYYLNLINICLINKKRFNRTNNNFVKGKQMIDLRELKKIQNIEQAIKYATLDYKLSIGNFAESFNITHFEFSNLDIAAYVNYMIQNSLQKYKLSKGEMYLINLLQCPRLYDNTTKKVRFGYEIFDKNEINISLLECFPTYQNEFINDGGIIRTDEHRKQDLEYSKR